MPPQNSADVGESLCVDKPRIDSKQPCDVRRYVRMLKCSRRTDEGEENRFKTSARQSIDLISASWGDTFTGQNANNSAVTIKEENQLSIGITGGITFL